jgi:hypothetical protein
MSKRRALKRGVGPGIALLGLLLAQGCSDKVTVDERTEGRNPSRRSVVRIVFDLPGDDIGGQEYRTILESIKAGIVGAKAGEIVSSGYGMGTMELVVATDNDDSGDALRRIVDDICPKTPYRMERGTR